MSDIERHVVLGTLAHELRGPLGPLRNAALAIHTIAGDHPQVACSLQIIQRQIAFIESVVEDLLETTRAGVGKTALHCQNLRLGDVVSQAVETCSARLNERLQVVDVVLPEALSVEGDRIRLQQVLVNLIQNASKFSPAGSRIRIDAAAEAGDVVLRVKDEGQGIASDLLPKIFELFTQAGPQADGREHGLGLGLGLVKSLVQLHGGTVDAHSDGVGKGTQIVVRLPVEQSRCAAG